MTTFLNPHLKIVAFEITRKKPFQQIPGSSLISDILLLYIHFLKFFFILDSKGGDKERLVNRDRSSATQCSYNGNT